MNIDEARQVLQEADCLVSEAEVKSAIGRLATEITARLKDANPVILCIMNGGLIFTGRLLPQLVFPLQVDYVHATRYGHEINGAFLNWTVRPQLDLQGRTVLLLDDILDEGVTLAAIAEYCRQQGAAEVLMAAYGAFGEKVLYGKTTTGTIRSTVVIGPDGIIKKHWSKVANAEQHPAQVLEYLSAE